MMVKNGLELFHFEMLPVPSELPAGQTIQSFWADFFTLGSSNSEGASIISKYEILDHFSPSFLTQKCWFQDLIF